MIELYWNRFPSIDQKDCKYMYTVLTTRMVRKIARRPIRDDGNDKALLYRGFALLYKARRELPTKDEMECAHRIIDSKWRSSTA